MSVKAFGKPDAESHMANFISELGGESDVQDNLDEGAKRLIVRYIAAHHIAIRWYLRKADQRREARIWYIIGSLAFMFAAPILILWATNHIAESYFSHTKGRMDPTLITAQITALLSGFIGVYKSTNAWMAALFQASNFYKAGSDLEANLYKYSFDFQGKAFSKQDEKYVLTDEARKAMEKGVYDALEIVRKQREAYFAASAPPKLDVFENLKTFKTQAEGLLSTFQSSEFTRAVAAEKKAQEQRLAIDKLTEEVKQLVRLNILYEARIAAKEGELSGETDQSRLDVLKKEIEELKKKVKTNDDQITSKSDTIFSKSG